MGFRETGCAIGFWEALVSKSSRGRSGQKLEVKHFRPGQNLTNIFAATRVMNIVRIEESRQDLSFLIMSPICTVIMSLIYDYLSAGATTRAQFVSAQTGLKQAFKYNTLNDKVTSVV